MFPLTTDGSFPHVRTQYVSLSVVVTSSNEPLEAFSQQQL